MFRAVAGQPKSGRIRRPQWVESGLMCRLPRSSPDGYLGIMTPYVFQDRFGQGEFIKVVASVTLLATGDGGRTGPIRGSYRPNHNFFGPGNREMTIGFIDLPEGVEVLPGQSIETPISFWSWPRLAAEIHAGSEWTIQEGAKVVGFGKVLEVIGSPT